MQLGEGRVARFTSFCLIDHWRTCLPSRIVYLPARRGRVMSRCSVREFCNWQVCVPQYVQVRSALSAIKLFVAKMFQWCFVFFQSFSDFVSGLYHRFQKSYPEAKMQLDCLDCHREGWVQQMLQMPGLHQWDRWNAGKAPGSIVPWHHGMHSYTPCTKLASQYRSVIIQAWFKSKWMFWNTFLPNAQFPLPKKLNEPLNSLAPQ